MSKLRMSSSFRPVLHRGTSVLLTLVVFATACLGAKVQTAGKLAAAMQQFVDDQAIAGAVMLVADKDRILALETVGYSDLEARKPMQPNDLFWIASMTKTITATALMMLVDEGKVNVNDPVEKYLPAFKGMMVNGADGKLHPPAHPVLVRELLSQIGRAHV